MLETGQNFVPRSSDMCRGALPGSRADRPINDTSGVIPSDSGSRPGPLVYRGAILPAIAARTESPAGGRAQQVTAPGNRGPLQGSVLGLVLGKLHRDEVSAPRVDLLTQRFCNAGTYWHRGVATREAEGTLGVPSRLLAPLGPGG